MEIEPFVCTSCGKHNNHPFSTAIKGLHKGLWCKYCGTWVKWLKQHKRWEDFVINFGIKHRGEKMGDIIKSDPMYLEWLSTQDWPKGRLREVLNDCMEWWMAN